jgi:hypothetical protein
MTKQFSILLLSAIILLGACRKKSSTYDGPNITDIYSSFKVISPFKADRDSVNFTTGEKVVFNASFNKIVDWKITITGATSKGVKIISGTSKNIDATNATWNGSITTLPMFAKEDCSVKLNIKDVTDSFAISEKIVGTKKLNGLIVADFENGLNTKWTKFIQSGASMDFQVKADGTAPEGNKYLNMAGIVNWDYLIGLIDFPGNAYSASNTFALNTNPDAVYFNCMIYGDASVSNPSIVLFQFKEDENADGNFVSASEDEYDLEVKVDWDGWKLVSIKYSDITSLVNGQPAVAKGNGLHNADKLGKISMLHLANPSNGFASSKLDLVMFTENSALQP